jgi:pyruvate/2-oxoglutarate dehydrogenase complex dihydrolipoamide acyltransferase (E2) component
VNTDGPGFGSAREEAERLVAAGLAVASTALHGMEANRQLRGLAEQMFGADRMHDLAAGLAGFVSGSASGSENSSTTGPAGDSPSGGPAAGRSEPGPSTGSATDPSAPGLSTGSADCCVCPVCRLIAALRNPSPEFAERLAAAAGDLAVGISGFLRALSGAVPRPGHDGGDDDAWHAATTAPPTAHEESPAATEKPARVQEPPAPASPPAAKKAVAKKAVAKKAVAKKTTAKKAVGKAVRRDPDDGLA